MGLFGFFKSIQERLKELVSEDIGFWRLMCTGVITSEKFIDHFPPSEKCLDAFEHKDWIFAALLDVAFTVGLDTVLDDWVNEMIRQMEIIDNKEGRNLLAKWEWLGDVKKSIAEDRSFGWETRLEQAFEVIGKRNVRWAIVWMFCNRFIREITTQTNPRLLLSGAQILYKHFYTMVSTSKSMAFAAKPRE